VLPGVGTTGCALFLPIELQPNAGAHLPPEAGATEERTLEAVRCSALLVLLAP